jgi:TRAP-type C4-dicarboxylate transport system substrate-binding protein
VKVTFYEAGTIGKSQELYDLALNGVVEAVHTAEFWTGGRFPLVEGVNSLPFTYASMDQLEAVDQALYDRGLLKELDPFKLLYFTPASQLAIFSKNKIATLEDFSGQKLRASGINVKVVELLGATAVTIPGEEEYMAIERGVLTGNVTGADNVLSRKLYEVMKYGCRTEISMGEFVFIMNKNFWDKLPPDIQAVIDNVNKEERAAHLAAQNQAIDDAWQQLEAHMEIYSLTPEEADRWKAKVSPLIDEWVKSVKDKGFPADEIMEVVAEYTSK